MSANTFGSRFQITTFGESHGPAMGVIIDGCPAGVPFDFDLLCKELSRRRPGSSAIVSGRNEADQPEVLSGVFEGKTLGTPIAVIVKNTDARSKDYNEIRNSPRPGHADDMWLGKFGHSDHRGGGRSSGRETLCRVIGGSIASMLLKQMTPQLKVYGFASQIGPVCLDPSELIAITGSTKIDDFTSRFPHKEKSQQISQLLTDAKAEGRSYGGLVELRIDNPPPYLGQPIFHKFKADMASAFLSIGATAGVSLGDGWNVTDQEGSQFHGNSDQSKYGGVRGGITTGEQIRFQIAFKPTATVLDHAKKGRHDPCIIPRAIPVIEAMAHLVLADHILWQKTDRTE